MRAPLPRACDGSARRERPRMGATLPLFQLLTELIDLLTHDPRSSHETLLVERRSRHGGCENEDEPVDSSRHGYPSEGQQDPLHRSLERPAELPFHQRQFHRRDTSSSFPSASRQHHAARDSERASMPTLRNFVRSANERCHGPPLSRREPSLGRDSFTGFGCRPGTHECRQHSLAPSALETETQKTWHMMMRTP